MQTHLTPCLLRPLPRRAGLTRSKAGRRLHSFFSHSRFLPPSINPTSLILHLHYDRRLSPALFIISSSFSSPRSPPYPTSHSLQLPFLIAQVQTLTPSLPLDFFPLFSLVMFTLETDIQQVQHERTGDGDSFALGPLYFPIHIVYIYVP